MKSIINIYFLVFFYLLSMKFSLNSYAAEVVKLKPRLALLKLEAGDNFRVGEVLDIYTRSGSKIGKIKVVKLGSNSMIAEVGKSAVNRISIGHTTSEPRNFSDYDSDIESSFEDRYQISERTNSNNRRSRKSAKRSSRQRNSYNDRYRRKDERDYEDDYQNEYQDQYQENYKDNYNDSYSDRRGKQKSSNLFGSSLSLGPSPHTFNVKSNIASLAQGGFNIGLDYKFSKNTTIGGFISRLSKDDDANGEQESTLLGLSYSIYFDGLSFNSGQAFRNGLILDFQGGIMNSTYTFFDDIGDEYEATVGGPFLGSFLSYGFFWDNFNLIAGAGFYYFLYDEQVSSETGFTTNAPMAGLSPTLNLSLGYTF